MSSSLKILVSGSGIAGSVFAHWMLRAYPKANITIVERAPALRLTGASVDLRSSAVDIMKWMGAEEEIRKNTTNEAGMQYVRSNGSEIGTLGATGRTDIQSITSEFEIFRGALAEIFIRPLMKRVKLVFNDYISAFEQDDTGVTVTFANSKQQQKYDLLVAADGWTSKIRGLMLNTNPREQVHDEGIHVAYFTIKKDLLNGSNLAKWYNTTGGRCILVRPDPHPEGRVRAHFMNVRWRNDTAARDKFDAAVDKGQEAYKDLMEAEFKDAGWIAKDLIKGMRECDDFYCSLFAQTRSPKLQSGRVVLLGDAGYATPGMGTSLAIMGAYTLAGDLMSSGFDTTTALKTYEERMQPFVKSQQGDDNAMQLLNPQTRWGLTIRNTLLYIVLGLKLDRLAMLTAAKLGFTEKKLDMPDYAWPAEQAE